MPTTRPLPLWAGRTLALAGILLVALNLRTAVAAISPIAAHIAVDIPLSSVGLGILGALPPVAFALAGLTAPLVARRLGLEFSLTLAAAAMLAGHLVRGIADSYASLLIGSIVALAGMGFGNILLPPAVKRYFPDRIGLVTTAYVTLLSVSTAVPAIIAAPVADAAGWRTSLSVWAIVALAALAPWLLLVLRDRRSAHTRGGAGGVDAADEVDGVGDDGETRNVETAEPALFARMLRSRVAWAIGLSFGVSSINAYATFAWLPTILRDLAGFNAVGAGAMLALYGIIGFPAGLVIPVLATRMRNVGMLIHLGVACLIAGYLGLLLAPTAAPGLWVVLLGLGPLIFPVCLVLINLRSRSHHTSIALSGVVQTIGYTVGAVGPPVVGLMHDATAGWTTPIVFLLATTLVAAVTGVMLAKPRYVEDDLVASRR